MSERNDAAVPAATRRLVLVEAGHRCAIPRCAKDTTIQVHHIEPRAEGGGNEAENLIVLCSNCHDLVERGLIGRKEVHMYKANLGVVSSRYGDLERRVLQWFLDHRGERVVGGLETGTRLTMSFLIRDGLVLEVQDPNNPGHVNGRPFTVAYYLTDPGVAFLAKFADGQAIT